MVNGKNENLILSVSKCILRTIMGCFSQLPWLPIAPRVFPPFHIQTTIIIAKVNRSISFWAGFEPLQFQGQGTTKSCLC